MKLIREFDDFEWVRNITPIVDGDDMYARATKGDSFTIRVKEEYRNKGCSDIYLIHGTSQSSIENVVFVDATNGIDVNDGNCNTARDGRALLLKFIEGDGHGHEGFLDVRSGSENDEIEDFCEGNCWWVHPQVIEVVSDNLNENKKDDDFGWAREIPLTFDENHQPSVGDVLVCLPGYNAEPEDGFGESNDPNCAGRGYAEGRIIVVGSVDVWDNNPEGKRLIVWPDEDKSTMYWDYDDICFECGIYGFALTYYTDTLTESDEDNGLDWIINTDPNIPVHFNNVVVGRTYRVEPTEVLYDAIVACDDDMDIFFGAKSVKVKEIDYNIPYNNAFCHSDRRDGVISLLLYFYDEDGYGIGGFWVTDDMVNLYEFYNTINENIEEEDNSLDWIINTDPNVPIPFGSIEEHTTYRAEPTEVLLQAIEACNGDTYMYNNIETAYVIEIIYNHRYDHIFCDSDRSDEVIGLRLQFYGDDGSLSGSFWVTDDMVNLYEHYGKLTENTEDEWAWAKDIEPGIELETNTLYYFEPKLTVDEIEFFGNNITNAPKFKEWLLDIPNCNSSVRTDGGITYLITRPDLPIRVQGWCTETSVDYAQSIYPGVKVVDARQTFNL